jgi:ATP-dependent Clp protease protease subunit
VFQSNSFEETTATEPGTIQVNSTPFSILAPTLVDTTVVSSSDAENSTTPTISKEPSPSLSDRGIFIISESFTAALAKSVITWILEANLDPNRQYKHLTLIINSPGGQVPSAFAIIDAMKGSSIPVHTIGLGQISSCGLLVFLAGTKGFRVLTPNTMILSHQWAWGNMGKQHELLATIKAYDLTTERIMTHYKTCTGLSEETIKEKLLPPHDVWLSTEEALEMNICDQIRVMGA